MIPYAATFDPALDEIEDGPTHTLTRLRRRRAPELSLMSCAQQPRFAVDAVGVRPDCGDTTQPLPGVWAKGRHNTMGASGSRRSPRLARALLLVLRSAKTFANMTWPKFGQAWTALGNVAPSSLKGGADKSWPEHHQNCAGGGAGQCLFGTSRALPISTKSAQKADISRRAAWTSGNNSTWQ